jgi:hypothetical protein
MPQPPETNLAVGSALNTKIAIAPPTVFTPVALPFKDENGVDFQQSLTPIWRIQIGFTFPFSVPAGPLPFQFSITRGGVTLATVTGDVRGTMGAGTLFNAPWPVQAGTNFTGNSSIIHPNAYAIGPYWQFPLLGGETFRVEYLGTGTVTQTSFLVIGVQKPLLLSSLTREHYEDKAEWRDLHMQQQDMTGFIFDESGYYVPVGGTNWEKKPCPVRWDDPNIPLSQRTVKVGYREAPLNGVKAIYAYTKNPWGGRDWIRYPMNDDQSRAFHESVYFAVNPAQEVVIGYFRRSQAGASGGVVSAISHYSTLNRTGPGGSRNENLPAGNARNRVLTAMGFARDGVWLFGRHQAPTDGGFQYTGPWGIQSIPQEYLSAADLVNPQFYVPNCDVWTSPGIAYADLIAPPHSEAFSVAVMTQGSGPTKVLFKRAPSLVGPWPADADADVIAEKEVEGGAVGLHHSWRIYIGQDGTLYLWSGWGYTRSTDGGYNWTGEGNGKPEFEVWTGKDVVYADMALLRDGDACSIALTADADSNGKLLFKRAPSPEGPWPTDSEAKVVYSIGPNSGIGLHDSYRIFEALDGTLWLPSGFGLFINDKGGESWT